MGSVPRVYVIQGRDRRDYSVAEAVLAEVPAELTLLPPITDPEQLIANTRDAAGLVVVGARIAREVLGALDRLQVVVRNGIGYDTIDVAAATELGVVVVNIPDLWIREVANHTLALLLAWNRQIVRMDRDVRQGVWSGRVPGDHTGSIYDETVGIVGLGASGSAFARLAIALDANVIAYDPLADDQRFAALGVQRVSLEELAARADYISIHTSLSPATKRLIGADFFRHTKPTALLINTSRGQIVDEAALADALATKRLGGAALDVWESEPPPVDHALLAMDNVIASAHAAFYSSTAVAKAVRRGAEEVARVLRGQRPLNVVNPEVYARGLRRR